MKGRRLSEDSAVRSLEHKKINFEGRNILIPQSHSLGNKSWGLVDFLVHYKHYSAFYVNRKMEVQRAILRQLPAQE